MNANAHQKMDQIPWLFPNSLPLKGLSLRHRALPHPQGVFRWTWSSEIRMFPGTLFLVSSPYSERKKKRSYENDQRYTKVDKTVELYVHHPASLITNILLFIFVCPQRHCVLMFQEYFEVNPRNHIMSPVNSSVYNSHVTSM